MHIRLAEVNERLNYCLCPHGLLLLSAPPPPTRASQRLRFLFRQPDHRSRTLDRGHRDRRLENTRSAPQMQASNCSLRLPTPQSGQVVWVQHQALSSAKLPPRPRFPTPPSPAAANVSGHSLVAFAKNIPGSQHAEARSSPPQCQGATMAHRQLWLSPKSWHTFA